MLRETLIRLSQHQQLRHLASENGLAKHMARRFVAGETLGDALLVVADINSRGMTATLDHLGENVTRRDEAAEATTAACKSLHALAERSLQCTVSVKLTQLGLDLGEELAFDNIRRVVDEAAGVATFVRIDMESSEYVDRTLELFFRLYEQYHNVGVVIQSYLYRSASDLERLVEVGARVRLVKGAYLEPPKLAFQEKGEVDAAFVRLMQMLLERGDYPAIATHDPAMIDATKQFARDSGIDAGRFEFQMLYGIRRDMQFQLVRQGYKMRIYVPYGKAWYPYLMRRMAERPANLMFVVGNIAREAVGSRRNGV